MLPLASLSGCWPKEGIDKVASMVYVLRGENGKYEVVQVPAEDVEIITDLTAR